ncbi:MAG: hypothetical protein E7030_03440 [Akkermansiaceae bacterium]|nr:hypothetical protein [Akkermansiaceae bacterium]
MGKKTDNEQPSQHEYDVSVIDPHTGNELDLHPDLSNTKEQILHNEREEANLYNSLKTSEERYEQAEKMNSKGYDDGDIFGPHRDHQTIKDHQAEREIIGNLASDLRQHSHYTYTEDYPESNGDNIATQLESKNSGIELNSAKDIPPPPPAPPLDSWRNSYNNSNDTQFTANAEGTTISGDYKESSLKQTLREHSQKTAPLSDSQINDGADTPKPPMQNPTDSPREPRSRMDTNWWWHRQKGR